VELGASMATATPAKGSKDAVATGSQAPGALTRRPYRLAGRQGGKID